MQTELTRLLGIQAPIIQGGMAWVANANLAANVSKAGGIGFIGAANAPGEWVRSEIRKAREITENDVLTVLEGPVSISDCLLDKDSCENSDSCVTKLVWEKKRDAMDNVMKSITLCDMVNNYNETHNINRLENDIYCLMNNEIKK